MAIFNSVISSPTPNVKVFDITIANDISTAGYHTLVLQDEYLKAHRSEPTVFCEMHSKDTITTGGTLCYISSIQCNYTSDTTVNHTGYSVRSTATNLARTGWSSGTISGIDAEYTGYSVSGILQIDSNGTLKIACDGNYKIKAGNYRITFMW